MAQPTFDALTLNAGAGGSDLAGDFVASKFWQACLVGYSGGDGAASVVMADTGLPIVPATGATFILGAGTAAFGKLAANSGVDIGDVDVLSLPAIPAGTNTIGGVIGQDSASLAYDGTTACTVKRFMVATSTDGATLIGAVASRKFRVLSFAIFSTSTTATNFWLEDADGTDVFGDSTGIPLDCDGGSGPAGLVLPYNKHGWWETPTANKNFVIKLTAAQKVVVTGTYIEVA